MALFDNQMMVYYGIHYPIERAKDVLATVASTPQYRELDTDNAEIEVSISQHVCCTTNSDRKAGASYGCIFIDEMSIDGDVDDDSEHNCVNLEPAEMIKAEEQNTEAVNFVTDMYELIIKEFKRKKIPINQLHIGWRAVACTFVSSDDSVSDDSASSSPTRLVKAPPGVQQLKASGAQSRSSPQLVKTGSKTKLPRGEHPAKKQ